LPAGAPFSFRMNLIFMINLPIPAA
jgi:hypothetical protein